MEMLLVPHGMVSDSLGQDQRAVLGAGQSFGLSPQFPHPGVLRGWKRREALNSSLILSSHTCCVPGPGKMEMNEADTVFAKAQPE